MYGNRTARNNIEKNIFCTTLNPNFSVRWRHNAVTICCNDNKSVTYIQFYHTINLWKFHWHNDISRYWPRVDYAPLLTPEDQKKSRVPWLNLVKVSNKSWEDFHKHFRFLSQTTSIRWSWIQVRSRPDQFRVRLGAGELGGAWEHTPLVFAQTYTRTDFCRYNRNSNLTAWVTQSFKMSLMISTKVGK